MRYDSCAHATPVNIKDYTIEGSNDNVSWTLIKSGSHPDSGEAQFKYVMPSTQTWRYVRYTAVSSWGQNIIYGDLRFGVLSRTGDAANPPVVADTTGPSVAGSAPADGGSVAGAVTITATASDNIGVASVELRAGGVL